MATYLGYPFDPELFLYRWRNEADPVKTRLFESEGIVNNAEIQTLISKGSDLYSIPFYKTIGGTPENYDGATNITLTDPDAVEQTGIVYGRAHGWKAKDFIVDYNSGADPMAQIVSQVNHYWNKQRQSTMLGILSAVFGITGTGDFADWENHKVDLSASSTTVTDDNKFGATTAGDAIQQAVGDNAEEFGLAFMHSAVANRLAGLKLLEYLKYTDANGIERPMRIATLNGLTVVVDDGCPKTGTGATAKYTTYLLGRGALQFAPAPVEHPAEVTRDALTGGGFDALVTRVRETIHPNGFSFTKPSGYAGSPTNAQLTASANWSIVANPKNIALAQVITNA